MSEHSPFDPTGQPFEYTLHNLLRQAAKSIADGGAGLCVESEEPRALRNQFYRVLSELREQHDDSTLDHITFTIGSIGELWLIPKQDKVSGKAGLALRHAQAKGDGYLKKEEEQHE
jgi:hypothetical protein